MSASPNLRLPYLDANQNQKSVTHNAALRMLDALVNLHVASAALSVPPAGPNDGQRWIVAPGGAGAWLGEDLNVAAWQDGAWSFFAPNPGFVAYVDAIGASLLWNGTAWVPLLGTVASLGIGTAADPANPLSARLNAALFAALPTDASPAGTGDVRVKLSKQAAGRTASLLFQDAAAGRAEIGLAGDDDLHVKVSADGATFVDALVVSSAGGAVSFLATPRAPTAAAGDATARLATTAFVASAVAAGTGFARTPVSDAAYAVAATDRTVAYVALSSARIVTLPSAANYPPGAMLTVVDESGACSATVTLTLAASGGDKVNGAASAVISTPYGYLTLESNAASRWTVVDAPAPVTAVAGRTGAVALAVADVPGAAPLASPALTGTPTAPNAPAGTNTAQVATTSFVAASFVTYAYAAATYATAANATLTGTPTAPTPAAKDGSTRLATTAYADRAAAANTARTQVNDAAYAILPADRTVAVVALTAARTLTLPSASAYPQGATLTVVDESGACSATATLTLAVATPASGQAADAVNGAASAVVASPYGYLALESNGANKWTVVDQAIAPGALATAAQGAAGSQVQFGVIEQLVALSGASTASTVQIPNRAIVFAVSSRTVAAVTGAPSYGVGVSGNATQFGGSLGTAAGSTNSGVIGPSAFYSPTPVVLTATSGSFTGGSVRIAIHYALFNVPTS